MAALSTFRTYWHTLRYLRPVQFYSRAWFKLTRPRPDLRDAPPVRARSGPWASPARRRPSLTGPSSFWFLNEEHSLAEVGWDSADVGKLWRYNQHYFDDLNSVEADSRAEWHRTLQARWVGENPPALGTGWEPYPTSVRIVNWVKWALDGQFLAPECIQSLAVQARWLARRLERHLLGNHLFVNAKALVFAGLYFSGPEAEQWLEKGTRILVREVPEQILADGGQFERSPMYHALALEDVLDLYNVSRAFPRPGQGRWCAFADMLPELVGRMRNWLAAMSHPDGEISFFNDAAFGIAPSPGELDAYARRIGFPVLVPLQNGVTHLVQSGYVRVQRGSLVALLDVAAIGPDYLPGHAHADTLSFELSLFGQRVLVNSGTSQYGAGTERLRQRGTAAHNTVTVDGLDSSEVWSGFRVARRARPFDLRFAEVDGTIVVSCTHDGYQRLPGRPVHTREWRLGSNALRVMDRVGGTFTNAIARFFLHPGVEILTEQALRLPNGERAQWSVSGGTPRLARSSWHPEFGVSIPNQCIEIEFEGSEISLQLHWKRI
ncbi:MAG: alginate lyase family protein [Burkholderiales bacterium]|nr:alginate lyase family protein [Burkholderiales bacterium]